MSHSGWQAPLANQLRSMSSDVTVVAPDRRGCGLNDMRGDLGTVHSGIEDVVKHVEFLKNLLSGFILQAGVRARNTPLLQRPDLEIRFPASFC